ncbi:hypothetical protein K443DRAFT_541907 [Laccaria amethystina LaAM-08-1]|uniref:Uncharacterized protein n=1 Tax=Laccaria amethystina LaAM-08-1 TaxID=1095629 RepID=A0A0C9XAX2_9AGAR|nr:hypothetical protein K443DRAFT_541907 [Laccaria amethystina LaAM-08-1]
MSACRSSREASRFSSHESTSQVNRFQSPEITSNNDLGNNQHHNRHRLRFPPGHIPPLDWVGHQVERRAPRYKRVVCGLQQQCTGVSPCVLHSDENQTTRIKDIKGTQPDSTDSYPAAVILVTSNFHVSTARKSERAHITGRISTAAAWALDPKENGCCVHIYAKNNTTADGYDNWLIKNTSNSKLSSGLIITSVATALANNRGVFGEA